MPKINRILVPVGSPDASTDSSRRIAQQAAWLARRFGAEIVLLHVVTPFSYPAGMLEGGHEITERDLNAHVIQQAQQDLDQALPPEFDGIAVTRLLLRGDPAREIVETADARDVDLIVMPTHDVGALGSLLPGSVTAEVLGETQCAVWTGAHLDDVPAGEFAIRRILCAVGLNPHSRDTVSLAAALAAAFDASLTLVHITDSVELYGPGGPYVDPAWKEKIVGFAAEEIATLQRDVGTSADVIIESGNVAERVNQVAERTGANLLIVGRIPGRSHLGDNGEGYGIIRQSLIPVLSV